MGERLVGRIEWGLRRRRASAVIVIDRKSVHARPHADPRGEQGQSFRFDLNPDDGSVVVRERMPDSVHRLALDHSEGHSALLDAVRRSGRFNVRMVHLTTRDYLIDNEVLIAESLSAISTLRLSMNAYFRKQPDLLAAATVRFS